MAPVTAPAPAPRRAPITPGLAICITRSPFVPQLGAAAVDTGRTAVAVCVTGAGAATRVTGAGAVTVYVGAGGVTRTVGAGAAAEVSWAVAAGARIIQAVVRPVPSAVVPIRARTIVVSFQGFCCMAAILLSSDQTVPRRPLFGVV